MAFANWRCEIQSWPGGPAPDHWLRDCGKWMIHVPHGDEEKSRPFVVWSRFTRQGEFNLARRVRYRYAALENAMRGVEDTIAFYKTFGYGGAEGGINPDA